MIALDSATNNRLGTDNEGAVISRRHVIQKAHRIGGIGQTMARLPRWMVRGYQRVNATDLASAVAFQALVAVVPMFLLLVSIAGLFLKDSQVLQQAILTMAWLLPSGNATLDAFTAASEARRNSGLFGALSLLGFVWVGTGFVSAMARSMNRIYGVPNAGFLKEKQRGFIVILLFALFFMISSLSSIITSFFVGNRDQLPAFFQQWRLAGGPAQILGFVIAFLAAFGLFMTIYRLVPNAGQQLADVWPGALISGVLFMFVTPTFSVYFRLLGGINRYGVALGLVTLMIAAFYAIAHVILFGCYVNATRYERKRLSSRRKQRQRRQTIILTDYTDTHPDSSSRRDSNTWRTETVDQTIR